MRLFRYCEIRRIANAERRKIFNKFALGLQWFSFLLAYVQNFVFCVKSDFGISASVGVGTFYEGIRVVGRA